MRKEKWEKKKRELKEERGKRKREWILTRWREIREKKMENENQGVKREDKYVWGSEREIKLEIETEWEIRET